MSLMSLFMRVKRRARQSLSCPFLLLAQHKSSRQQSGVRHLKLQQPQTTAEGSPPMSIRQWIIKVKFELVFGVVARFKSGSLNLCSHAKHGWYKYISCHVSH